MQKGSCLCGAVSYEIEGELGDIGFCHCSRCRKATGTAFQAAVLVSLKQFRLLSGEENMVEFVSSLGVYRVFCGACGSPLWSKRDAIPGAIRIRIGALDTPVTGKTKQHIYVSQKAEWYDICDDAPQYAEEPN